MAVAAVAASVMVPVASRVAGFSICAVGDSITQGGNTGFVAHRIALKQVLDANDWSVEWKAARRHLGGGLPRPSVFDPRHQARGVHGLPEERSGVRRMQRDARRADALARARVRLREGRLPYVRPPHPHKKGHHVASTSKNF